MQLITTQKELNNVFSRLLKFHTSYFWNAPWANSNFPYVFELSDNEEKIKKICIGLNRLKTNPIFINEFFDFDNVRYHTWDTVHNAITVFLFHTNDNNWDMLMGSLRLDKTSFEKDPVYVFHFTQNDDLNGEILNHTINTINTIWNNSKKISEDEYELYWEAWSKEIAKN